MSALPKFPDEGAPHLRPMSHSNPPSELIEQLMEVARASALEEMASGIAHELNQPLGAIATFAQAGERMLARPLPLTDSAIDALKQISHAAMGAGEGLRRIRKLFNRDLGHPVPCFMGDLVMELRPVIELIARRAGMELTYSLDSDLPRVSIDRREIQHVLFVLVQNAIDASRGVAKSRVQIQTSFDGHEVETAVTDEGSGIAAAIRADIFHPFFSTKPGGSGLGLASSRTIIESHGGSIGFEDADGRGTRFWFRLPMVKA